MYGQADNGPDIEKHLSWCIRTWAGCGELRDLINQTFWHISTTQISHTETT